MNTTNTKQVLHSETPFTFVQVARGKVRQVVDLEHPAVQYAGVRGYCFNNTWHALATLLANDDMRPYRGSNLEALVNYLLQRIGSNQRATVTSGFGSTERITIEHN